MPEVTVMRCVLLCTLETVICLLEVSEVMRCALLCLLEALKVLEAMRCVLLCMVEATEGGSVRWRCRR